MVDGDVVQAKKSFMGMPVSFRLSLRSSTTMCQTVSISIKDLSLRLQPRLLIVSHDVVRSIGGSDVVDLLIQGQLANLSLPLGIRCRFLE